MSVELDNPSSIIDHLFNNFSAQDIQTALKAHEYTLKPTLTMREIVDEVRNDLCDAIEECDSIKNIHHSQMKQFVLNELINHTIANYTRNVDIEALSSKYVRSTYNPKIAS